MDITRRNFFTGSVGLCAAAANGPGAPRGPQDAHGALLRAYGYRNYAAGAYGHKSTLVVNGDGGVSDPDVSRIRRAYFGGALFGLLSVVVAGAMAWPRQ